MNRFLKLVNFELNRFMNIYLVLIALTVIVQAAGVIVTANAYMDKANQAINEEMLSAAQFIEQYGAMSFLDFARGLWFTGPIAVCAAALLFYIFMIWYRDWLGKNTFIYRLLMLPTARLNVYLAKATSIVLMVLGLVSVQLIILPLENSVLKWMVPADFRTDMTVGQIVKWDYLSILVPQSFTEFILYYGAGFMAVSVLFTAILFERSFKWKGIFLGIGYAAISAIIMLSPLLATAFMDHYYLYPLETFGLEVGLGLILTALTLWMGHYLLTKKITV
ncbi:hypothetical protein SAMN04488072_106119 [Lentibacillus halodurans]|uniref:ABC-2 family transporter protein n=1 Tax=Lentibacillus halodurans TaxID=237679 RepID=A0A1I0XY60_9BACI|nr:hypothetical protein [Lentibacillus halodurans]SFB05854.1 hypothetical protein SAMN04488072_106119 [Lentibacillus halodurans]